MPFKNSLEMECVALPDVFDTKVINKQAKHNRAPLMAPQARSGGALLVAVLLEMFSGRILARDPYCGRP